MARPRIFVSSTYYDLKHIRSSLEAFIKSFGYEPVLFESGEMLFFPDKPLDDSCYSEIKNCQMQILIIGGSYGSPASDENVISGENSDQYKIFNSITKAEFEVALEAHIPIFFFVEDSVLNEYSTFKKNRENQSIKYASVDSTNIFLLLDEIFALKQGNYVQPFTNFTDISEWLKTQWAHLMSEFISNRSRQIELQSLRQNLESLNSITESLKDYSEAILNNLDSKKAKDLKKQSTDKQHQQITNAFKNSSLFKLLKTFKYDLDEEKVYDAFSRTNDLRDFLEQVLINYDITAALQHNRNVLKKSYELAKVDY